MVVGVLVTTIQELAYTYMYNTCLGYCASKFCDLIGYLPGYKSHIGPPILGDIALS